MVRPHWESRREAEEEVARGGSLQEVDDIEDLQILGPYILGPRDNTQRKTKR